VASSEVLTTYVRRAPMIAAGPFHAKIQFTDITA
jgi:hypothetical protein